MSRVKDKLFAVLKDKERVITKAAFWKIPRSSGNDEINLKIGRYKKPKDWYDNEEPDMLSPKSELTLDPDEFHSLINFLRENYEPFKQGVKAFIPLDQPFEKSNADQIKRLFSIPDTRNLIKFIMENNVIPEELEIGLRGAKRMQAINQFQIMLNDNLTEYEWQRWFKRNSWILGSEFINVLDERRIDTQNISDFLMKAYDGFLDIVEIKRPEGGMKFWAAIQDHGNYVPSSDLIKAITQASKYIYEVEKEANSIKFQERIKGLKIVKPRSTLIFGRSFNWNQNQIEAYRVLNSGYHNLNIMTYDHVLERAKRIIGLTN